MFARKSFKLKLILSYVLIVVVSLGFVAFFLDKNLEKNSLKDLQSSLISQARLIAVQIPAEKLRNADRDYLNDLVKALRTRIDSRLTVINTKGEVLADSDKTRAEIPLIENHLYRPEVKEALKGDTGINTHYSSVLKIDMLYVALPIIELPSSNKYFKNPILADPPHGILEDGNEKLNKENNEIIGVLRLALPLESVQRTLFSIRKIIFAGLLFSLALAFVLGSFIAGNTIRPINRMTQVARRFSEGDFSRRVMPGPDDEIGELAATLNKMAQDIEDKIAVIKSQGQKFSAMFNSMVEGVIVVDGEGVVASINPTIEKIFAVSKSETEGRFFLEAIRNNEISDIIDGVLKKNAAFSGEIDIVLPVRKILQVNAVPIFDQTAVTGCLVVIHDVSHLRQLEIMRKDFVANVSHELKTPLTSIKGFVETLLGGALNDKENNRNFLKIIQNHTERLGSLVADLLSLSHLESKEIVLEKKDFNVRRCFEEVLSGFKSQITAKGIEIKNELPRDLLLKGDENRMTQVLTNLVDNAIKFNKEKGYIKIISERLPAQIKIIVEDSGIGIPEKDIPRIFERFYRVDKARSRELGGTGLGLSIVKHIIELHGGRVGVESIEGLGSKFWFSLPA